MCPFGSSKGQTSSGNTKEINLVGITLVGG
jgi:hypothetical protein